MSIYTDEFSVITSVLVEAPAERAFKVFTEDIGRWWPAEHHLQSGFARMVLEPHVGGHIYDIATDGSECRWARVLVYEPPVRVVFSWAINPQWQLETDPGRTSEVEVRFVEETPARTRVELEHRHLDRHGDGWEVLRDAFGSPEGWLSELKSFASLAASA
jgi:uncharacterized protein YndB with AHSA1/START domain